MSSRALRIVACLAAGAGWAQPVEDGGRPFEPRAVNPGAVDAPAGVLRDLEPDAGVLVKDRSFFAQSRPDPAEQPWALRAWLGAQLRASYQGATPFPLDATLQPVTVAPLMTRVRVTPEVHLGAFGVVFEADSASGAAFGEPNLARDLVASAAVRSDLARRVPFPKLTALELRKLYVEYVWDTGAFRVGQQTSSWGLGLLTNDGAREPGPGDFGQQQFGDLTYRALLVGRPLAFLSGPFRSLETSLAVDLIARDDRAEFGRGDRAFQGVLAVRYQRDAEHGFGLYGVYRNQRNILVSDGSQASETFALDLAGTWEFIRRRSRTLKLGWELTGAGGTATEARGLAVSRLRVARFGGAVKAAYRLGRTTVLLDAGFASGDQDPSDGRLQAFRFDRDFKVGLVLFDHVLAYQTARSAVRLAMPASGLPPAGLELTGTGGAITGAWYLFPRVTHAFTEWLDLYGGPLFAFSTAALVDPFNSLSTGGTSVNALGAVPGRYLGTEIDLGVQARYRPIPELLLSITGEGGLFLPGDAFNLPGGGLMGPVGFGRVRLCVTM